MQTGKDMTLKVVPTANADKGYLKKIEKNPSLYTAISSPYVAVCSEFIAREDDAVLVMEFCGN